MLRTRDRALYPALRGPFASAGLHLSVAGDASASDTAPAAVLHVVGSAPDWRVLHDLVARNVTVVVLLRRPSVELYRRAFNEGAAAVAPAEAGPGFLAHVTRSALGGHAVVPVATLRQLHTADSARGLGDEDYALLLRLAGGANVAAIAAAEGCSERTLYRRLRRLYSTLQVRGRSEAVHVARSVGLLAQPRHVRTERLAVPAEV
jgi:DNA-binding NarL/FixJ family response regulator